MLCVPVHRFTSCSSSVAFVTKLIKKLIKTHLLLPQIPTGVFKSTSTVQLIIYFMIYFQFPSRIIKNYYPALIILILTPEQLCQVWEVCVCNRGNVEWVRGVSFIRLPVLMSLRWGGAALCSVLNSLERRWALLASDLRYKLLLTQLYRVCVSKVESLKCLFLLPSAAASPQRHTHTHGHTHTLHSGVSV